MIAEGYSMDLYCDYPHHTNNSKYHEMWQDQFVGKNRTDCKYQAQKIGWKFKKDGTVICPICNK